MASGKVLLKDPCLYLSDSPEISLAVICLAVRTLTFAAFMVFIILGSEVFLGVQVPNYKVSTNTRIRIPNMETLQTLSLGTLGP